ncbi:rod shape-determining protein MreD [Secundilactobacillus oryzae JCM 18671]|uniref:Rod shape-determining protein MreD n=1 Tax=Secundilactobacillus oryzae JCM 18671 TaxID=1291743 RepID=A0A081BIQ4_9LACO|nr:rod shape-determining protein MreD [Secundilactobacillus oryzae]GAK47922.1 rod shape-determining protein MreD [Secundilactobacillus oryzae JCM 18671]
MLRLSKLRYGFPIGLFLFFFLDGSLSKVFSNQMFSYPYTMVSYLVVLWLVCAAFFEGTIAIPLIPWAIAMGVIFDLYYTGIFGIFIAIFPLIIMLTRTLIRALPQTFLMNLLIFFIDITVVATLSYIGNSIIHQASLTASEFLLYSLAPTLAYNLAMFVILYFPIQALYGRLR